jgi:lysozyme family protein
MRSAFDRWIAGLLDIERGFVDDPQDLGGPTNWGISLRFALDLTDSTPRHPALDVDGDGDVDAADIRRMPRELAVAIYREQFWNFCRCDELPAMLAIAVADAAVNQGRGPAITMLQGALGVKPDGLIGPVTLGAAAKADANAILIDYLAARAVRYVATANYGRYGRGWFRRLFKVERACLAESTT